MFLFASTPTPWDGVRLAGMVQIKLQNLSPVDVPHATTFLGVPLVSVENARFLTNGLGGFLEVVRRDWGRGWALAAAHTRGHHGFGERLDEFVADPNFVPPEVPEGVRTAPYPWLYASVRVDGVDHPTVFQKLPRSGGGARASLHTWFGRAGTSQHVVWLHVYESAGAVLRFEGMIGTSDYRVPDTVSFPESITFHPDPGVELLFDFAEQREIRKLPSGGFELVRDDRFMHGQGFAFTGRMVLLDRIETDKDREAVHAATIAPLVAQVVPSEIPADLLPFGVLPTVHPSHKGRERELALADYRRAIDAFYKFRGSHWDFDGPYTGVHDPRRTGSTETFGIVKACPALACPGGFPAHLYALLPDIYSEAKRPSHFFEPNGLPFLADLHPNFEPDGHGPHYDKNVNPDTLGKPERYTWHTRPTGGWQTEDWAHSGSSIALGLHAVLAGSALSRMLCLSDTEMYKTIRPGRKAFYQARGLGRSLLDIVYANIAVGDPALTDHVRELLANDPGLADVRARAERGEQINPYEIDMDGDPRKFEGASAFWMPWSAPGLLLPGLLAAEWLTGELLAETEILGETLARFGCWQDAEGRWRVADAITYDGPVAHSVDDYDDPNFVRPGTYEDWVYPGLAGVASRLRGAAHDRAVAYCNDVRGRIENGPPPREPFARPIPFLAVEHPIAGDLRTSKVAPGD